MDTQEQRGKVREAFRKLYLVDRGRGQAGDLPHYKMLFPGFWDIVAEEYDALRAAEPPPAPEVGSTVLDGGPEAAAEETPGDLIGPYRTLRELGRGGMGVVYLAEDMRLHRRVALKVLAPQFATSRQLLLRFRREAEVASRIDHPGICAVYDADVDGEVPYIAMRFVEGRTLQQWIAASREPAGGGAPGAEQIHVTLLPGTPEPSSDPSPVPTSTAGRAVSTGSLARRQEILRVVQMMERAARALHVAHEAGLIHRDIKPGNIIVTDAGEPVVLDFGLARADDEESANLTQTGSLMGTPAYMSPEQLMAQRIKLDRRTDVYSLGATLYECVTLRPPFEAPTLDGLYQKILTTDPDNPRRINGAIPEDLRVVIETALEKDRTRRYQTALDFAEDLRRVREMEPIQARPIGAMVRLRRWAQRNPALAASVFGLFAVLAAGLGTSLHLLDQATKDRKRAEDSEGRTLVALKEAETERMRATEESARARDALKKEEAERILKEGALRDLSETLQKVEAERDAKTRALAEAEGRRLPIQSEAVREAHPALSLLLALEAVNRYPTLQGRNAVVGALESLREMRTLPVARRLVGTELRPFLSAVPCPDGRTVAGILGDGEPFVADLAAGTVQAVAEGRFSGVVLDGGGGRALFLGADGDCLVLELSSRRVICRIAAAGVVAGGFSPDGRTAITMGVQEAKGRSWTGIERWDAVSGRSLGQVTVSFHAPKARLTPDGRRFVAGATGSSALIDAASGKVSSIVPHPPGNPDRWVSPDGSRSLQADAGLLLRGVQDTETQRTVADLSGEGQALDSAFSGDGGRVAIAVLPKGRVRVWNASGGGLVGTIETGEPALDGIHLDEGGTRLAARAGKEVSIWSVATGALIGRLRGHAGSIHTVAFAADGRGVVTAGADSTIRAWDLSRPFPFPLLDLDPGRTEGAAATPASAEFSRDGHSLLTLCRGRAVIWDASTGTVRHRLDRAGSETTGADLDHSGARAVTVHGDGTVTTWDTGTGMATRVQVPDGVPISRALYAQDGANLVLVTRDRSPLVVDLASGAARRWQSPLAGPSQATLLSVEVNPAGERIVTAEASGVVRLHDLATGREISNMGRLPGQLAGAVFAPDGRSVYRVGPPHALWDPDSGDMEWVDSVPGVASPPGTEGILVGASSGPAPALTGVPFLPQLRVDPRTLLSCTTDPSGPRAVTVGRDGMARLWSLPSGEETVTLVRPGVAALSAVFAPGGEVILVQYRDGKGVLWPADPVAPASSRAPRGLTPDEMDRYSVGTAEERAAVRARWRARDFDVLNGEDPFVTGVADRIVKAREDLLLASAVVEAIESNPGIPADERAAALRLARTLRDDPRALVPECLAAGIKEGTPRETVEKALRVVRKCLQVRPGDAGARRVLPLLLVRTGATAEAREALAAARVRPGGADSAVDPMLDLVEILVLSREGAAAEARAAFGRFLAAARDNRYTSPEPGFDSLMMECLSSAFGPRASAAMDLLGRVADRSFVVEALRERIRDASDAPEDVRETAIAIVESMGDSAKALQGAALEIVRTGGRPAVEYERALGWAERAAKMAPGPDAQVLLGMALVRLGRFDEALADFADLKSPTWETGGFIALAHWGRGDAGQARRVLEESHRSLLTFGLCGCEAEGILLDPADLALRLDLGRRVGPLGLKAALLDALRADPAVSPESLKRAEDLVRSFPDDPDALNNAAWNIVKKDGASREAVQKALRWVREVCERTPGNGNNLNTRGVAEYRAGEFETALETLKTSGGLNAASPRPQNEAFDLAFQAMCLARLGRLEESRGALARAVDRSQGASLPDLKEILDEARQVVGAGTPK